MIKQLFILTSVTLLTTASEIFKTKNSKICKEECIDKNNYFCPNSDGLGGVCCSDTNCQITDFCSFHAAINNKALTYWACPHEKTYCGIEYHLVPVRFY